jgi:1-deoxy-D-xylulose-5-phosphate reductoisomerase
MKKKIAILGSTGSIGKNLLDIISKDKKNFHISLLSTNKNYAQLLKQAKLFNVKNLIIINKKSFEIVNKKNLNNRFNIYNNFESFNKIFKKKIDYTMSSIIGLDGLKPTIDIIKYTKKIVIANKESIVCGWNLIEKELKKNKTKFIPVDSEHFSIWYALQNNRIKNIDKIYLTASGGPFLKKSIRNINLSDALKHPNWKMGKKISIDSATMMNKVFEIIEAKNIFNISYNKLKILTHPSSYVHAILKFHDGLTSIILHDTTMKIPIYNTLYFEDTKNLNSKKLDFNVLNNLDFQKIDIKKFPLVKIIDYLPNKISLFETVIVSANDKLVDYYLNGEIKFDEIQKKLLNFINNKEFRKFKRIRPKKIENIINLNKYVRLKIKP